MSYSYGQSYIQNPYVFGSYNNSVPNVNFHERGKHPNTLNDNFLMIQKKTTNASLNQSYDKNPSILENKSQVSHARNIKHRLFDVDPTEQAKKQSQKMNYRKQLQVQIKKDKQRKERQKRQLQEWQMQRQKKFNNEVKAIKAKQTDRKQQSTYFILRSSKQHRKNLSNSRNTVDQSRVSGKANVQRSRIDKKQQVLQTKVPKIMRRGGYHNESNIGKTQLPGPQNQNPQKPVSMSRIRPEVSQLEQRQLEIVRERNYEQERITSIMKLQEKMLKKLDNFKQQIIKTNKHLDLDKEVQYIRNILKSKPIRLQVISIRDNQIFQNNSDFYHMPRSQFKPRRQERTQNRSNGYRPHQGLNLNHLQQNERQNTTTPQRSPQAQQRYEPQRYSDQNPQVKDVRRKRQIKLFDRSKLNDKNFTNPLENSEQIHLPIVNERNNSQNYQNQSHFDNQT